MRGVMLDVPRWFLEERRRKGIDKFDEMWDGEIHMVPPPSFEHGRTRDELTAWLLARCKALDLGVVQAETGLYRARRNWRVPDIAFVSRGRVREVVAEKGFVGAPDVVFEVRSPRDETYEKLPFYAGVGVPLVVVIDRDTKRVELFRLGAGGYEREPAGVDGWHAIPPLRCLLRTAGTAKRPRLRVAPDDRSSPPDTI